jgi:hypothetical protein|tara:strand:- start:11848 stop:12006 length:159 start_codon:yes stop_codon:yes gene_type:complete
MPIWLRKFHIHKISEWNKKQNEEAEKAQNKNNPQNQIKQPNINPSDIYNFKK